MSAVYKAIAKDYSITPKDVGRNVGLALLAALLGFAMVVVISSWLWESVSDPDDDRLTKRKVFLVNCILMAFALLLNFAMWPESLHYGEEKAVEDIHSDDEKDAEIEDSATKTNSPFVLIKISTLESRRLKPFYLSYMFQQFNQAGGPVTMISLLQVYLGFNLTEVALVGLANIVLTAISLPFTGILDEALGRRRFMMFCTYSHLVAIFSLTFIPQLKIVSIVLTLLLRLPFGNCYEAQITNCCQTELPENKQGLLFGAMEAVGFAGVLLGTAVATVLASVGNSDSVDYPLLPIWLFVVIACGEIYFAYRAFQLPGRISDGEELKPDDFPLQTRSAPSSDVARGTMDKPRKE